MNNTIEDLLKPVSAEQVCGPDLSNDPSFDELETLLKGKPEVEMGSVQKPAEPPDWAELRKQSAAFLAKSKHLRVAVMFCGGLLRTEGLAGFRDGLQLVAGLLEQYWAPVHPQLDPDDNNDPARRLNIMRTLTLERGAPAAGWLTVVDYLYLAQISRPKGLAPITFEQVISARQQSGDNSRFDAAIKSAGSEALAAHRQTLNESLEAVNRIDQFLTTTVGSTETISFEVLQKTLNELLGAVNAYLPDGAVEPGTSAAGADSSDGEASSAISVRGPIRSRDDIVKTIDGICEYYAQVEPGSPVPYLLRRVQKMVTMNFIEAIQELNIATIDTLRPSMGSVLDAPASSVEAPQEPAAESYGTQS